MLATENATAENGLQRNGNRIMFTFRTNATSSHKHYNNGIGEHDVYVEFATLHVNVPRSHLVNALGGLATLPTKLTKTAAYSLLCEYATSWGVTGGPELSAAAVAAGDALLTVFTPPFIVGDKCHCGQLRVWAKRQWAVNALGYVIDGLKPETAPPKTVGALWTALNAVAMQFGMLGVPDASDDAKRLADAILFDSLPLYGKRQFAPTPATPTVAESTELTVADPVTTLAESTDDASIDLSTPVESTPRKPRRGKR